MERFYKVHEGFDLSGMSDIDYTDTFADILSLSHLKFIQS